MTARDEANEKAPPQRGFLLSASYYRPPGAGVSVEPLGEGLISMFPDGFSPLFAPAAALPALLDMPVLAPIALPDVVPVAEDPVDAPLVAAPPAAELPLAAPLLDCASAKLLVKTSAAVNPIFANFMIAPFVAA